MLVLAVVKIKRLRGHPSGELPVETESRKSAVSVCFLNTLFLAHIVGALAHLPGVARVKPGHGNSNCCQNRSPGILVCFLCLQSKN